MSNTGLIFTFTQKHRLLSDGALLGQMDEALTTGMTLFTGDMSSTSAFCFQINST